MRSEGKDPQSCSSKIPINKIINRLDLILFRRTKKLILLWSKGKKFSLIEIRKLSELYRRSKRISLPDINSSIIPKTMSGRLIVKHLARSSLKIERFRKMLLSKESLIKIFLHWLSVLLMILNQQQSNRKAFQRGLLMKLYGLCSNNTSKRKVVKVIWNMNKNAVELSNSTINF